MLEIVDKERPLGVIVQYGGQTPLKLARSLEANGVPIIGTTPDAIDRAEDRERFQQLIQQLGLLQPPNTTARSEAEAVENAALIGYPLVVRPSYVLGGRAMEIVYDEAELNRYMHHAVRVSNESPVLLDRFLDDAIEVDVDAICDGKDVLIGGIMEHIEQAGVHSGDSACSLPPYTLSQATQDRMRVQMAQMAHGLNVVGLMNAQFAIKGDDIYILEVNPRASRTVPFVSKAIGVPLAKVAARCMVGQSLAAQGFTREVRPKHYFVKEAVFPFIKFPGVDTVLGPEMKSTGEVMGVGESFGEAYAKAQEGAGTLLPIKGKAMLSVRTADRPRLIRVARDLLALGFTLYGTRGTAKSVQAAGLAVRGRQQGHGGTAARGGHDQEPRGHLHRQHHRGRQGHRRLGRDPPRRAPAQGQLHHHDRRGRGHLSRVEATGHPERQSPPRSLLRTSTDEQGPPHCPRR